MLYIFFFALILIPIIRLVFTPNLSYILICFLFSIISSLRPEVGADYEAYYNLVNENKSFIEILFFFWEPISSFFIYIGQKSNVEIMLICFSLPYSLGIFYPIKFLNKKDFITYYYILLLIPCGFLVSFNNVRQAAAIGLFYFFYFSSSVKISYLTSIGTHISNLAIILSEYISNIKYKFIRNYFIPLAWIPFSYSLDTIINLIWKYEFSDRSIYGKYSIFYISIFGIIYLYLLSSNASNNDFPFKKLTTTSAFLFASSLFIIPISNSYLLRILTSFFPLVLLGIINLTSHMKSRSIIRLSILSFCSLVSFFYYIRMSPETTFEIFKV